MSPGPLQEPLQGPVQYHAKAPGRIPLRPSQDLRTRNCRKPWARSGRTLCATLRSRNAHGHLKRAILRESSRAKCRTPRFRPTFAELALSKCTWTCHKSNFIREFRVKGTHQDLGLRFVRACTVENAHGHVTRDILRENSRVKCRTPRLRPIFCASLRGRNAHWHVRKIILRENSRVKCRRPKASRTRAADLGASLRSRNAHENLREECWPTDGAPWSSNGLDSYCKNRSVWTQCWGKNAGSIYSGCSLSRTLPFRAFSAFVNWSNHKRQCAKSAWLIPFPHFSIRTIRWENPRQEGSGIESILDPTGDYIKSHCYGDGVANFVIYIYI